MQALKRTSDLTLLPLNAAWYPQAAALVNEKCDLNDKEDFLMSTYYMIDRVFLVVKENDLYAVFYPNSDYVRSPNLIEVNAVVNDNAYSRYRDQTHFLKEYISILFKKFSYSKVIMQVSETNKFNQRLAEHLGFVLEGTHRQEYHGEYDLLYYGLLKEELDGK